MCVCLCAREYKNSGKTQSFPVSNFVYTGREIFLFRKIFILGYLIDWFMWITFFRCASIKRNSFAPSVAKPDRRRFCRVRNSESAKRMQIRLRLYYLWNVENKKNYFNYWGYTFFAHFGSSVFWSPRIHSDKESGKRMKDPTEFASLQSPTELRHCKVRPNSPHRKIWPNSQHWKIRPNSQHCKVRACMGTQTRA